MQSLIVVLSLAHIVYMYMYVYTLLLTFVATWQSSIQYMQTTCLALDQCSDCIVGPPAFTVPYLYIYFIQIILNAIYVYREL